VSTLSASRFSVSTLYAVSQLRLAPGARNYRDVTIAPEWQLIEPNGYQVQTSRSGRQTVTLKRGGTPAPFISTFALTSSVKPPVGRWQLRLVTSGQVLRTLGFSVTR
jgi:hypothetical protein